MASKPSQASEFFQRIIDHPNSSDSISFLRNLVLSNPPTSETDYLEFKGASPRGVEIPEKDLKKTWSEAVAGYATTSGGVLIWGIDARPGPDGIDQARDFSFVLEPYVFKSRLQNLIHQASDPPVPDIRIEALVDPNEGNKGFVVCFIPESPYKPHRAEIGGKRWVMRVACNFVDIPPAVLRSLFFPHRTAYFYIRTGSSLQIMNNSMGKQVAATTVIPRLTNEGPATLEDLYIRVMYSSGLKVWNSLTWKSGGVGPEGWGGVYPEPIHPGQTISLPHLHVEFHLDYKGQPVFPENGIDITHNIFAKDHPPIKFVGHYSIDDLKGNPEKFFYPEPLELTRIQPGVFKS